MSQMGRRAELRGWGEGGASRRGGAERRVVLTREWVELMVPYPVALLGGTSVNFLTSTLRPHSTRSLCAQRNAVK